MDAALATDPTLPFAPGDLTPWFVAPTPDNPKFNFNTLAGRYVLLGFLPPPGPARDAALQPFVAQRALFDDRKLTCFMVLRDAHSIGLARNQPPGLRWFFDPDDKVNRLHGAVAEDGTEHPYWLLLDPMLRTLDVAPMADAERLFAGLAALPPVDLYAGVETTAPVVIVPRVFEPELCQRLIALYEDVGGAASGVMRDIDGKTVGVLDNFKRRRDVYVEDPALRQEIVVRLNRRLLPEIQRVYQFEATRIERYLVACYDAAEGGYFRPHRDNESFATQHRRFAVSINLNAEAFSGGDLRFPEFGQKTYRPPTGGAVVFSCSLQHEATAVTEGRRYAFLPFLYDDASEVIRLANQSLLDTTPAAQPSLEP